MYYLTLFGKQDSKRLGLNMRNGNGIKASKTEAVYFPSRSKI